MARHEIETLEAHRAGADCRAVLKLLSLKNRAGDYYFIEMVQTAAKEQEGRKRRRAEESWERDRQAALESERRAIPARARRRCLTAVAPFVLLVFLGVAILK